MPRIDVTALGGTKARMVERGSVLQVHRASWPTRTARRTHILWISLTSSFRSTGANCAAQGKGTLAQ